MNGLTQNWISFFHESTLPIELLYDSYRYLSSFTANNYFSIEELARQFSIDRSTVIALIKDLEKANICVQKLQCPYCNGTLDLIEGPIVNCKACGNDISVDTIDFAFIVDNASVKNFIQKKYEDEVYELNAEILSTKGKSSRKLFYLITDIEDSQTKQRTDPNAYSYVLNKLWTVVWPAVFRVSKRASLPLLARGDAVSIVFSDPEDMFCTVSGIGEILQSERITELTIYGSEIRIGEGEKIPFMRSIDKKWDLNTPSVTDLYRKASFKPKIWELAADYVIKYCFLDEISLITKNYDFFRSNINAIEDYNITDKHSNKYNGKAFCGYC